MVFKSEAVCCLVLWTTFSFSFSSHKCCASDSITTGNSISSKSNETLVSAGGKFELGFFNYSRSRYLGIWYYLQHPAVIVWVANRDKPLPDSATGIFRITDGNLTLSDENGTPYFSEPLGSSMHSRMTVRLQDSGNLVVSDDNDKSGKILWESFDSPTDTFLRGMKMNENLYLTSWSSPDDPAHGNFTFQQDEKGYIIQRGGVTYWRSKESGSFSSYNNMYGPAADLLRNSSDPIYFSNKTISIRGKNETVRLLLDSSGRVQYLTWENKTGWSLIWSEPRDNCSIDNFCGDFGVCNTMQRLPPCKCLRGFEPRSPDNWYHSDFSAGCKRKLEICGNITEPDTFLNLTMMRVRKPESPYSEADSEEKCRMDCLNNCRCRAYSYNDVNKSRRGETRIRECWIWTLDLNNLQEEYDKDGHNISIRVVASSIVDSPKQPAESPQPGGPERKQTLTSLKTAIIVMLVFFMALFLCSIAFILYRRRITTTRRESREESQAPQLYDTERQVKRLIVSAEFREEDKKGIDVPFFDLESILEATDYFSDANKLGQGGFGPVYKGKFPGGQEIAVKRLSSHSGQGLEEFKNEVVLIAKLQHRNLVRLLGYCIKGDEQILLYEYMPNKSLDAFIFDRKKCMLLNWGKRFDIILGIARGLLYLHQDSRLRIIHRDLKTSNILLDEEMNPKISDFGLARIVGGKETEAKTNRVVGTYGYMSPEYALDGLFSIKSDAFSFGVIVLEIVSGRRNTGFYQSKQALSLLGYAWRLWKEEKPLDLMDSMLLESCNTGEVLKCIIVGLLCVQEDPRDRPNMSNVLFMLGSETSTLPNPKEPAFVAKGIPTGPSSSSSKAEMHSFGDITVSAEEGR